MLDNLYKFKKDSWHAKFYQWIYGQNPVNVHRTMCPYFWKFVFTIIFIVPILFIKGLIALEKAVAPSLRERRYARAAARTAKIAAAWSKPGLTPKQCYEIMNHKKWWDHKWELENEQRQFIVQQGEMYSSNLWTEKRWAKDRRKDRVEKVTSNPYAKGIAVLVSIVAGGALLFGFGVLMLTFWNWIAGTWNAYEVDWKTLKHVGFATMVGLGILTIAYILTRIQDHLWKGAYYIAYPFIMIFKGLAIVCHMIYMLYKKACPLITWED